MSKLPYLINEINAAMEIYLSGRTGQQYNRTAFILCDDCAELAIKLFLLTDNLTWKDIKSNGHFKRFNEITAEIRCVIKSKRPSEYFSVDEILKHMEDRRRRNEFFHSTHLLDLNFHARDCIEAFIDLLDLGALLFKANWLTTVAATGNMETCEVILRLDKKSYIDPCIGPKLNDILSKWPRSGPAPKAKGSEVTNHAEDMHLRLCVRNGGKTLRDKLRSLF